MRRLLLMSMVMLTILSAPLAASATDFDSVTFTGGCTEWSADMVVYFRIGMTEAQVSYDVQVLDSEGVAVLATTGEETVYDDDGDRYGTLVVAKAWSDLIDGTVALYGQFTVRGSFTLYVPWLDIVHTYVVTQDYPAECAVVPNEDVSWSTLKSEYR